MKGRFQLQDFDLESLPAMPSVAAKMIELSNAPETSAEQFAQVVEKDAAVSARVLKIANSPYYSMSRQVTTLAKAIVVLGQRTLRSLVLAASLRGLQPEYGRFEKMLWEESMVMALASRFFASALSGADPEEAFLAGLFCHLGKVAQFNLGELEPAQILTLLTEESTESLQLERELFGYDHGEIGAALLEHWNLSEAFSLVALHHFDPHQEQVQDPEQQRLIALVNLASALPAHLGIYGAVTACELSCLPGATALQLDPEQAAQLLAQFSEFFNENREQFLG